MIGSAGSRVLATLVARQRANHHHDAFAHEFGRSIRVTPGRNVLDEPLDFLKTKLLVRHFAATKTQGDFYLHILAKKLDRVIELHPKVVRIDAGAKLNLFDLGRMLALFRFLLLLGLLVAELSVIDQPADGRCGGGRNFHQVHPLVASHIKGILQGEHPELGAIGADDADFAGANFAVYLDKRITRR